MRMLPIGLRMCCMAFVCAAVLCHGQVQQSWARRYAGRGGSQHLSAGPVLSSNAVYVAGEVQDGTGGDVQMVLVGYGQETTAYVETLYNPGTNQTDTAGAVEVLPDGNLIMVGTSASDLSTALVATKLTPSGTQIWSRRFDAANFDPEQPVLAAFDPAGNIYVAGTTLAPPSDVVTVKYSADGQQQWAATFTGLSAGAADDGVALKADPAGNVYVTGNSQTGSDLDLYTVKYGPDGNPVWARRYGGPLRQQENAGGLVVDGEGNVYVSGASVGQTGAGVIRYELAVVKYGPTGNQLWTARYGLPGDISEVQRAIVVDPHGNVLVLANVHGGGDNDWLLLKFDRDGNRLWTARHNGVEDGYDSAYALALDGDGNAYVAGVSDDPSAWRFVTAKYDSLGNRRWVATFDADGIFDFPVGIAAGRTGDVYVAGQSRSFTGSGGFLTIRYTQAGSAPPGSPEILTLPSSQTVPGGSNVTFTVSASGSALTYQWRYNGKRIPDATNSSLTLSGVVLEQSGQYSVEVSNPEGSVASPEADLLVLIPPSITEQPRDQFAYAGTEVTFTASAYGTEPFQFQWFRDQTPLSNGLSRILTLRNVQVSDTAAYRAIVSNISGGATTSVARLTVSPLVQQQWVNLYDGPGHDAEANPIVKVDGAGNVYVGGTSPGTNNADFVIIKYHPAGARLWTARYSSSRETTEALFAMEVDAAGTVWATGTTATEDAERNALTASFGPDGDLRWAKRFGVSNSFSAGFALAVDGDGNCYVAGQSDEDFLTLKYDAAGTEHWARAFNGAGDGVDTARALAVSGTDIYVTGSSWNGSNLDFLTLKYTAEGSVRWRAIYDAAETDNAVAVAIDPAGDVVVTGNSYGTINYDEYGSDYLVVKYSPEGARLWTARYDGFMNAEDYPSALAIDAAGNVYVTGASDYESPDSGVRQFATLKYAPDGRELWRSWHIGRQNDGSRSIAVDASGNVYITSLATGPFSGRDIGLIKYDAFGTRLLTARYSGTGNADDLPSTLALGPGGEVYVTGLTAGSLEGGIDFVLIKYGQNDVQGLPAILESPRNVDVARGSNALFSVTATGEPPLSYQWFFNDDEVDGATASTLAIQSAQFANAGSYSVRVANVHGSVLSASAVLVVQAPPSILVPPQSQMVVAGSTASLNVTADGSGPFGYQWVFNDAAIWDATNRQLVVPNVQLTNAGSYSVIVSNRVGFVQSAAARLRVTSMAQQQWDARFPGFDSGGVPVVMAAGADGSIHVAAAVGSGDGTDLSVTKFDAQGTQAWSARYNGPGDSFDVATDIAVDHDGNVYVTGDSWGGETLVDGALVKFDRDGNRAWVARFNGPNNSEDIAHALAVDTNGNVAVAISSGSGPNNVDYMTVCYNALGTQKWVAVYDGPAHSFDQPADIMFDSGGRVYVTGSSTVSGLNTDFATVKYETNGVELWRKTYRAARTVGGVAVRLGVDASDSVYVAGWSSDSNHVADYAIVKYLSTGQQAWSARYDGLSRGYDYLSDLIVDLAGNCYVTGSSHTSTEGADWITLKLNANGQRLWLATFGGRFGVGDSLPALAFDASGNVCLAGSLYTGESFAAVTARYDTNGNRVWTATYGADTPANEFAEAIATDRNGNVFVGGTSYFSDAFESFVVKYAQADVPGAPVITRPPASKVVMAEGATSFTVSAEGEGLNYQWLRGHFPLGQGGSTTNLVISNAGDALAGYYSVEVQNDLGTVVSPAAELRVAGPSVPRLSATVSSGVLRLVVLAEGEFNYRIEASSDLRNWETITTTYNQYSSIVITEPLSATYRYYRAVKLP